MFHWHMRIRNKSPNLSIGERIAPFTERNSEQNSSNLLIWEQMETRHITNLGTFTEGTSEQNSPNL